MAAAIASSGLTPAIAQADPQPRRLTNIKSAIRKVAKRITKGKVIKMAMKLPAALWWASACVVGMISTSPAESG